MNVMKTNFDRKKLIQMNVVETSGRKKTAGGGGQSGADCQQKVRTPHSDAGKKNFCVCGHLYV